MEVPVIKLRGIHWSKLRTTESTGPYPSELSGALVQTDKVTRGLRKKLDPLTCQNSNHNSQDVVGSKTNIKGVVIT